MSYPSLMPPPGYALLRNSKVKRGDLIFNNEYNSSWVRLKHKMEKQTTRSGRIKGRKWYAARSVVAEYDNGKFKIKKYARF